MPLLTTPETASSAVSQYTGLCDLDLGLRTWDENTKGQTEVDKTQKHLLAPVPAEVRLVFARHVARDVGVVQRGRGIPPPLLELPHAAGAGRAPECGRHRRRGR